MGSEPLLSANPQLEVGELTPKIPTPGVTPGGASSTPIKFDSTFTQWVKAEITASEKHVLPWREVALQCYKFRDGNQYDPETRRMLRINQRPDTAFNTVQKYVRYVSGIERRSPQGLFFEPTVVDNFDQQVLAEFLTNSYEWVIQKARGNFERSRAFEDLITGGMGWTTGYLDRLRDPRGLIQIPRISPFEMFWPDCADDNLRSTRWRARESLVDKDDACRRWPDHALLIKAMAGGTSADGFEGRPELDRVRYTVPYIETEPVDKAESKPSQRGKVKILEFQWYTDEEGYVFPDPVTGEPIWVETKDYFIYRRRLQIVDPQRYRQLLASKPEKAPHRVVRVTYFLNRQHQLDDPIRLPGDRFTLNCMTGHFDEETRQWYGLVRIFMDPQRYANKFFNQVIEIVATSAKGGWMAETDAFTDTKQQHEFEDTAARPGSVNMVAPGALKEAKIQPKPLPQIPAATMAMLEFCVKSMDAVSGLDASALGMGNEGGGQMPAMTMRQRQQIAGVLLGTEWDALSRYRQEDEGPMIVHFLSLIADDQRLIRIGGPEAAKVFPLFRQPFMLEYDVRLDDTDHDPSMRQQYSNFILQAGPMLAKQGLFVPEMFNYLPFPVKVRRAMVQAMMAAQQEKKQAAAQGINLGGRGPVRDPRETQARIENLQSNALLHTAKAKANLAQSKREDLRAIVEALQGFGQQELERDQHDLERQKHGLDHQRHRLAAHKAAADTITQLIEAMKPDPAPHGGGE